MSERTRSILAGGMSLSSRSDFARRSSFFMSWGFIGSVYRSISEYGFSVCVNDIICGEGKQKGPRLGAFLEEIRIGLVKVEGQRCANKNVVDDAGNLCAISQC